MARSLYAIFCVFGLCCLSALEPEYAYAGRCAAACNVISKRTASAATKPPQNEKKPATQTQNNLRGKVIARGRRSSGTTRSVLRCAYVLRRLFPFRAAGHLTGAESGYIHRLRHVGTFLCCAGRRRLILVSVPLRLVVDVAGALASG